MTSRGEIFQAELRRKEHARIVEVRRQAELALLNLAPELVEEAKRDHWFVDLFGELRDQAAREHDSGRFEYFRIEVSADQLAVWRERGAGRRKRLPPGWSWEKELDKARQAHTTKDRKR